MEGIHAVELAQNGRGHQVRESERESARVSGIAGERLVPRARGKRVNLVETPARGDAGRRPGRGKGDRLILAVAGANERGNANATDRQVTRVGRAQVEVHGVVHRSLLEERQHADEAAKVLGIRAPVRRVEQGSRVGPTGEDAVDVVVVLSRQTQLLQVVDALNPAGGFASGLNGRQQQRDEHGDDGNHHKKLDQRKTAARSTTVVDHGDGTFQNGIEEGG